MTKPTSDPSVLDVLISAGTQILAVGAIQAASNRDLEHALPEAQANETSTRAPSDPHSTSAWPIDMSTWDAYAPAVHRWRLPLALVAVIGFLWLAGPTSWEEGLDVICVLSTYVTLVLCVDIAAHVLAKAPVVVRNLSSPTAPTLTPVTPPGPPLHHPFVSLIVPAVLLVVFSKDNVGCKPVTVAAISIAALVTTNARWDLPLEKVWKTLSTYSAVTLVSTILMLDVNRDIWRSLPSPSPWICGMLAIFPAALPAVLPGLLITKALRHDYLVHLAAAAAKPASDVSSSDVESAATEGSGLNNTLPEFPAPTFRAAMFAWISSVIFIFALGVMVVPKMLRPGREVHWPMIIITAVYLAMFLSARRRGTLLQLIGGTYA